METDLTEAQAVGILILHRGLLRVPFKQSQQEVSIMFTAFFNTFLSYVVLMLVIVILAGVGVFLGITLAKKKNLKQAVSAETAADGK